MYRKNFPGRKKARREKALGQVKARLSKSPEDKREGVRKELAILEDRIQKAAV